MYIVKRRSFITRRGDLSEVRMIVASRKLIVHDTAVVGSVVQGWRTAASNDIWQWRSSSLTSLTSLAASLHTDALRLCSSSVG